MTYAAIIRQLQAASSRVDGERLHKTLPANREAIEIGMRIVEKEE